MQLRRHRMRQQQRRDSAREWIRSGATVTVSSYAKRYGVDRYTAYEDLTAVGLALPDSAQRWAHRPPTVPRRSAGCGAGQGDDEWWIMLDGRLFLVVGHTSGGAPYGMFADEMSTYDSLPETSPTAKQSSRSSVRASSA